MTRTKKAFTLVELSLAIAFLGMLLLSIAYVTIEIGNIYQKGLAIKSVTATGSELIDNFSRNISASPIRSLAGTGSCNRFSELSGAYSDCVDDNGFLFTWQQYSSQVSLNGKSLGEVPITGVFCTGRYSYIWNTGYALEQAANVVSPKYNTHGVSPAKLHYRLTDSGPYTEYSPDFRLLVVEDSGRNVCAANLDLDANSYTTRGLPSEYRVTIDSEPVELLSSSEDNLALYSFVIFPPAQHRITYHTFYSGTFILATIPGGVDITGTGEYCTDMPDNLNTDFNYCAINKFNFAMRATGELKNAER